MSENLKPQGELSEVSKPEGLLTSNEAAAYLGIAYRTFAQRVQDGKIKPVDNIPSSRLRFEKSELDDYVQRWKAEREERRRTRGPKKQ